MFNILQLIVYCNLIKVNLAANTKIFLSKLKDIALGEFIPYDWLTEKVRKYFIPDFEQVNLIDIFDEMGVPIVVGTGLILSTLLWLLLSFLNKKLNR